MSINLDIFLNWRWLSWPPKGILPDSGIEPASPALQADSLLTEPSGKPKYRYM